MDTNQPPRRSTSIAAKQSVTTTDGWTSGQTNRGLCHMFMVICVNKSRKRTRTSWTNSPASETRWPLWKPWSSSVHSGATHMGVTAKPCDLAMWRWVDYHVKKTHVATQNDALWRVDLAHSTPFGQSAMKGWKHHWWYWKTRKPLDINYCNYFYLHYQNMFTEIFNTDRFKRFAVHTEMMLTWVHIEHYFSSHVQTKFKESTQDLYCWHFDVYSNLDLGLILYNYTTKCFSMPWCSLTYPLA